MDQLVNTERVQPLLISTNCCQIEYIFKENAFFGKQTCLLFGTAASQDGYVAHKDKEGNLQLCPSLFLRGF